MSLRVGAIVLAAGRSSRMGGRNKLLELIDGVPVVARVVRAAVDGGAAPVVVVTGHQSDEVESAVRGVLEGAGGSELPESLRADASVEFVHNRLWADGMSTSISAGVAVVGPRVGGLLICLGDMPRVSSDSIATLIRAYEANAAAFVPTFAGQRGNPVLWTAAWLDSLRELDGDRGAKSLLDSLGDKVVEVEVPDDGILRDVDTPDALERERRAESGG